MPKLFIEKDTDAAENPWTCPDGTPHELVYRGKAAMEYQCRRCGKFIKKSKLKEMTDNA